MIMDREYTHERVYERDINEWNYLHEYLVFLRHEAAYRFAKKFSKPDYYLLDYGTGAGYGSKVMAGQYKTYYGVDVSGNAIEHAREQYVGKNVNFIKLNKDGKVPFSSEKFDLIISFQVIEHVEKVQLYLSEIFRVLKKNGKALITTPNRLLRSYKYQRPIN